jgi:hypothetical protein
MPKRANAKKMAAQAYTKMKSLDAATTDGKFYIARVEKALGNCGFQATIELPNGRVQEVQVLVRGKMKGGRACATRVEVGNFVLADGDITKKVLEVVGVVNRQAELDKLKRSGRVSRGFVEAVERKQNGEDEDIFDREGVDAQEEGIWEKKDEERSAQAAQLLGRYMQREAEGVRYRLAAAERAGPVTTDGAADDEDDWEDAEDDGGAAGGGGAPRRRRVKRKPVTVVPNPAEAADGLNLWSAGATACEAEDAEVDDAWTASKFVATRKVPERWDAEDDLDAMIDAI